MKKLRRTMSVLAFTTIPLLWICLNLAGIKTTHKKVFIDWKDYKNSNKAWGMFDG